MRRVKRLGARIALVGPIALVALAAACGGSPGGGSASGSAGLCKFLTEGDFSAIGKTLTGQPIFNHESAVQVRDCYYNLGGDNDLVYLDFFDTSSAGQQNYTNATDPAAGNGTPVAITGVGDSAYWLASGNTLFAKKRSTVFQIKIDETGKTPAQLQADATTLAVKVVSRIH